MTLNIMWHYISLLCVVDTYEPYPTRFPAYMETHPKVSCSRGVDFDKVNAALPCWKVRTIVNDDVAWDIVFKAFTHGPTRAFSSIGTKATHDWSMSLCTLSGAHNVSSITFRAFCPCTWKLVVHWPSQKRLTFSSDITWILISCNSLIKIQIIVT
jgi:hypothetical protein